jgi:hypothetical protein
MGKPAGGEIGVRVRDKDLRPHCYRLPFTRQTCGKCGTLATQLHVSAKFTGYFCEKCCPLCTGKAEPKKG